MPFLNNVDQMRSLQWGATYLWDVMFIDPLKKIPVPFDDWFPATNVDDVSSDLESKTFESAQDTFRIPAQAKQKTIKITFVDTEDHLLFTFFENWIGQAIFDDGNSVATVAEIVKLVQLVKLDSTKQRQDELTKTYWVYPEGSLTFAGNSETGVPTYTVTLVKVGTAKNANTNPTADQHLTT